MTSNKSYADGYATVCLECSKIYMREKRKDINFVRANQAKKFNTTIEHLNNLFENNSVCQICKTIDSRRALCIDHNHTTGEVRGLLCDNCNRALGFFKDSIDNLNNAVKYLKEY
jgi:hypothetical protein